MGQTHSRKFSTPRAWADRKRWQLSLPEQSSNLTDGTLCRNCANLLTEDPLLDVDPSTFSGDSVNSTYKRIRGSIKVKGACTFCKIAVEAIRAQSYRAEPMQVRKFSYHIPTSHSMSFLVNSPVLGLDPPVTGKIRILADDKHLLPSQPRLHHTDCLGRRIYDGQIDFELVRSWMAQCDGSEYHDCTTKLSEPIDLILIDVHDNRLVQRRSNVRYVALSYVWGQAQGLQTGMDNYSALQKMGSLSPDRSDIPRTIADAMRLVQELHERYLWVDMLCIIQDSDTKHHMIQAMGEIYSHATVTIIALSGKDANHGLPGMRPGSRPSQTIKRVKGIRLLPALPDLAVALHSSLHTTRGWTFQEVLLSSRCLFLSDRQAYFHCTEGTTRSEDTLNTVSTSFEETFGLGEKDAVYESMVQGYTQRTLTFPADVLDAFCGVPSLLNIQYGLTDFQELIAGLPLRDFLAYLLWSPKEPPVRRSPRTSKQHEEHFPSWSWAGWICPVEYITVRTREIRPGIWRKAFYALSPVEFIHQSTGDQKTIYKPQQPHGIEPRPEHGNAATAGNLPLPNIPSAAISKIRGRSVLRFRALGIAATRFSYSNQLGQGVDSLGGTDVDIRNIQGHQCGHFLGRTPSELDRLLPKCSQVFLLSADADTHDGFVSLGFSTIGRPYWNSFFLLIYPHEGFWERVALAKINWDDFAAEQPEWEDILLA